MDQDAAGESRSVRHYEAVTDGLRIGHGGVATLLHLVKLVNARTWTIR
jgi:hypothetical protein